MIKKKLTKLIGIKYEDFLEYKSLNQIQFSEAKLIPTLKTGDEGALTSIFLSALKLIKEFRFDIFKELKLSRGGKQYYFTEISFPEIDKNSRFDGLVITVSKGIISEAVVFEMKNKNNSLNKDQIEKYVALSKSLGIKTLVSVSNDFVPDSSQLPIKIKPQKAVNLFHFSWTYILTKGHLLLFRNDDNIKDDDQVELMKEVLSYIESPISGVSGYVCMKPGWKETCENIANRITLKTNDFSTEEAVLSWHEKEKDMALLLSRQLGVLVKSSSKNKDSLKNDIKRIVKDNELSGNLSIKNSVSDIKITLDFETKSVAMSVKVSPPLNKGTVAKIGWMGKQLESCKNKNLESFQKMENNVFVEADIKFIKDHVKVNISDFDKLIEDCKGKEIQSFNIVYLINFGASFKSVKKFIVLIEQMVLQYYSGVVQHLTNWNKPAPKL